MIDIIYLRLILILVGCSALAFFIAGLKKLLTVNEFVVGPQMKQTLKYLNKRTKGKVVTDKELRAQRRREREERVYMNAANRMGITIPFEASKSYTSIGLMITGAITFLTAFGVWALNKTGILFDGILGLSFMVFVTTLTTFITFQIVAKPFMGVRLKRKEADKAINEEILLLLSIMKNSKEENIRKIIETFSKSSKILKVDLQILLQEINIYGLKDGLTRLGERLNHPIASQFIIAIKAISDVPTEQRGSALGLVERDILDTMQIIRRKESARITRIMGFVIVGSFAAMLLVFLGTMFGEITVSFKEVM